MCSINITQPSTLLHYLHPSWHWSDLGQLAAHRHDSRGSTGPSRQFGCSHPGLGIRGINTSINCTNWPQSQRQLLTPFIR